MYFDILLYLLGAVIIFTALLSVAFLGRVIKKHMWVGMFTVIVGLILVGLADIVFGSHDNKTDTNGIIAGMYNCTSPSDKDLEVLASKHFRLDID